MPPDARLAELGALFALGYRRFRLKRQNELAEAAKTEAPCDHPVDGSEADPGQETARS